MAEFTAVDWGIVGILGLSMALSLWRGFVKEALSLLGWVAALFVARFYSPEVSVQLESLVQTPSLRFVCAFLLLFITTLFCFGLVTFLISRVVHLSGLSSTDRLLGAIFGIARGGLVVGLLVLLLPSLLPVKEDSWWQESRLIPHFERMVPWAKELYDEKAQGLFDKVKDFGSQVPLPNKNQSGE